MDFSLKKLQRGHKGLNLGLVPGPYVRGSMPDNAIHIAEDAFWFLEPGIQKHVPGYANYGHYGVTQIPREKWLRILDEWEQLRLELDVAQLNADGPVLHFIRKHTSEEFIRDFERNRAGLSMMIANLDRWIREELENTDQMFIAGI
jgi:hypothetical protein